MIGRKLSNLSFVWDGFAAPQLARLDLSTRCSSFVSHAKHLRTVGYPSA